MIYYFIFQDNEILFLKYLKNSYLYLIYKIIKNQFHFLATEGVVVFATTDACCVFVVFLV